MTTFVRRVCPTQLELSKLRRVAQKFKHALLT